MAIHATVVRTGEQEYEVDAIVYATGFDAMTGTLFGMGITGRDGLRLQDKWRDGPRTYLGFTTLGFPTSRASRARCIRTSAA
jgi:cyclohexanone monooxygenase